MIFLSTDLSEPEVQVAAEEHLSLLDAFEEWDSTTADNLPTPLQPSTVSTNSSGEQILEELDKLVTTAAPAKNVDPSPAQSLQVCYTSISCPDSWERLN